MEKKDYTLAILVENAPGVLSQVARLFSRKGYNIDSIASGTTENPEITRITIVAHGDEGMIRQTAAQLSKLYCVISVSVLDSGNSVQRELLLVKVKATTKDAKDEIIQIVNVFRAGIVDISRGSLTVSIVGSEKKAQALIDLLGDFGILEIVRTGAIAIQRGAETIYDRGKNMREYDYGKSILR